MKRRRFLQSTAALFPFAFADHSLLERAALAADEPQVHLVPAQQDRLGEQHTRGFSKIAFKVLPKETGGGLFLIEHNDMQKGGPPLHLHYAQEEWFYIVEGTLLFQVGDQRVELKPGDSVLGPRGVPHTFTLTSDKPGRMLIAFTPAGQMEDFFREGEKPGAPPQDAAFFARFGLKWLGPPLVAG
ncbi:MAG: cupin domain-containing protein [Acidobacteriaceae bacterium]